MRRIWAIADLHLSFGVANKKMDVFGSEWEGYTDKLRNYWLECIDAEDLVLIAGDISWAKHLRDAMPDLQWIAALPGTKVLIKGNHDYWWSSLTKVREALPSSLYVIQNDAFNWNGISIGGARLWDTNEYNFNSYIDFKPMPVARSQEQKPDAERQFERELERLELSLQSLDPKASMRIAMTHYPPISATLAPSRAATLLQKYNVSICVFGHLHRVKKGLSLFGTYEGVLYELTACDYLNFKPILISSI